MNDSSNKKRETDIEKTSVVSANTTTFKAKLLEGNEAPPAIVCLIGPQGYVGKQWSLTVSDMVLGRSVESPIFIDDKSLSRQHARFAILDHEVSIMDLGSTNKTSVNGKQLPPMSPYLLKNNDQFKVGSVTFKFLEKGNVESIANRELNDRMSKDALTGIYNRAALLEKGPEALKRSEVLSEPLSLLVFDLDFFKKINDTWGHDCGDYVLQEVAALVSKKVVRGHDFFARFGGEEFVILLSGTPAKIATDVAERLRTTIEQHQFEYQGQKLPVTISIGGSSKLETDSDWQTIFKRADEALYASKNGGRNRVTIA